MCVYTSLSSLPPPLPILISPICRSLFVLPSGHLSVYSPRRYVAAPFECCESRPACKPSRRLSPHNCSPAAGRNYCDARKAMRVPGEGVGRDEHYGRVAN